MSHHSQPASQPGMASPDLIKSWSGLSGEREPAQDYAEINGSFYLSISDSLTEKNTAISEPYQWDVKTCLWYLWMSSVVGNGGLI